MQQFQDLGCFYFELFISDFFFPNQSDEVPGAPIRREKPAKQRYKSFHVKRWGKARQPAQKGMEMVPPSRRYGNSDLILTFIPRFVSLVDGGSQPVGPALSSSTKKATTQHKNTTYFPMYWSQKGTKLSPPGYSPGKGTYDSGFFRITDHGHEVDLV